MTSEIDVSKTNEILRRRKLRLQQVREQSKDIAKKVRQRAKVEKLRQVLNLDSSKEKQYFQLQEKLVDRLEQLYSKSLQNVGTGHKDAIEVNNQDTKKESDLSKVRGKEAVAELRRKKQEKLDEQKKQLDRKLKARETANELSREKSITAISSLKSNSHEKVVSHPSSVNVINEQNIEDDKVVDKSSKKNDMATQWELDELPREWEPNVTSLSIPKDDKESHRVLENDYESSNKSKRINLFALSDEMPDSLRGSYSNVPIDTHPVKTSTTIVSEYLQNRHLRLRETEPECNKRSNNDLQSIKQTILRTRASKVDGNSVCHVLDEQLIPVPAWHAENNHFSCQILNTTKLNSKMCMNHYDPYSNVYMAHQTELSLRRKFKASKICQPVSGNRTERTKSSIGDTCAKRHSTVKDHGTRDVNEQFLNNKFTVVREQNNNNDDDAYTRALKETLNLNDLEHRRLDQKKAEMRNKVAITKDKVDKEYNDTLAFLNSLAKTKCDKPIKEAYMDDVRQTMAKEKHQKKLHEEFTNIQREHCKRNCKHTRKTLHHHNYSKCDTGDSETASVNRNIKYDWMPVPEGDGNLAIHTVPVANENKANNSVKFSDIDTYHEYRSRHKHTPPSKDDNANRAKKKVVETVLVEDNNIETDSSISSESSQSENNTHVEDYKDINDSRLSDGDKIVIYKIVQSKTEKKSKRYKRKNLNKVFNKGKENNFIEKMAMNKETSRKSKETVGRDSRNIKDFENFNEGIYKATDNGDNIAALYFDKNQKENNNISFKDGASSRKSTEDMKTMDHENDYEDIQRRIEDNETNIRNRESVRPNKNLNSATTSTNSFRTANDKTCKSLLDCDFLKLVEGDHDTGKFIIGASGILNDNNNYEVVIQLKKKEAETTNSKSKETNNTESVQMSAHDESKVDVEVQYSNDKKLKETAAQTSLNGERINADNVSSEKAEIRNPSSICYEEDLQTVNQPSDNENKTENVKDAGVHTTFKDSFAIPIDVPKTDPVLRPATSTCTQTSFSSPNARPPLLHMISSTSTTYMSPPEIIHPKFFEHLRDAFYEENHMKHVHNHLNDNDIGNHFGICRCKGSRSRSSHKKTCKRLSVSTGTPPNTVRSFNYDSSENYERDELEYKNSIQNKNRHTKSNPSTVTQGKSISSLKSQNINPVMKQYVNKLLGINKDTLKAVEVINQDCSAIETPGSSIINDPSNIGRRYKTMENKISLEQIKIMIEQQITDKYHRDIDEIKSGNIEDFQNQVKMSLNLPRKKHVHKVKSLNISKNHVKTKKCHESQRRERDVVDKPQLLSSSSQEPCSSNHYLNIGVDENMARQEYGNKGSLNLRKKSTATLKKSNKSPRRRGSVQSSSYGIHSEDAFNLPPNRTTATSISTDSDKRDNRNMKTTTQFHPTDISTQTSVIDSEINFMKLAENKLQNMEKIADLTEKCTKRLSNLAKVLEEVRRNKSLVYGQISTSDSASDSEPKREKINAEIIQSTDNIVKSDAMVSNIENIQFVPLLTDIPKPMSVSTSTVLLSIKENINEGKTETSDQVKSRGKPPPALSRVNLKNVQEYFAVPHELSTVMEVDSPMSVNLKSQSSRRELFQESVSSNYEEQTKMINKPQEFSGKLQEQTEYSGNAHNITSQKDKHQHSKVSIESPEESKAQMMDMKIFNEIMLKPFVSLQEYVKQCNGKIDEGSNLEDVLKDDAARDELSSLHSDVSLPDVISELLKRKLISEPFKFDTGSNGNTNNTTSVSSESSLPLLALSKIRKEKRQSNKLLLNKENLGETSGTLSFSSNPDLEYAFKKMGMGWASSTLKKTKERLALSSSSNTSSSSSLNHLKPKSFIKDESSSTNEFIEYGRKMQIAKDGIDCSKNAVQQTSLTNSMTVKEFLTNELAKKITFTHDSTRKDDQFISLYETKMPDEIKNASIREGEQSGALSPNIRARTSTPVQIYKSATYHSTSSSNTSNGLFSNADELSSVKVTSTSIRNHSNSDKDDLTIPNYSLKRKGLSDYSKSD